MEPARDGHFDPQECDEELFKKFERAAKRYRKLKNEIRDLTNVAYLERSSYT